MKQHARWAEARRAPGEIARDKALAVQQATLAVELAYELHPAVRPLVAGLVEAYAATLLRGRGAPLELRLEQLRDQVATLNTTLANELLAMERRYQPGPRRFARGLRAAGRLYRVGDGAPRRRRGTGGGGR